MTSRSKIMLLLMTMVFTIVLALYISFAWFNMMESTEPILINTGSLRVFAVLYKAEYDEDDKLIYTEVKKGDLAINLVTPGENLKYRIIAKNEGSISGKLSIKINDIVADKEMLPGFKIAFFDPTEDMEKELYFNTFLPDNEGKVVIPLFSDCLLESQEIITFDFDIIVTSHVDSSMNNKTLLINSFVVNLHQYKAEA